MIDILTRQQEQMRNTLQNHSLNFGLGCGGILMVTIGTFSIPDGGIGPLVGNLVLYLVLAVTLYYGVQLPQTHKINLTVQHLSHSNAVEQTLHVQKIRFLSRGLTRDKDVLSCLILTDDQSQEFYYILPYSVIDEKSIRKTFRNKLMGTVNVLCYTDSKVIREFSEDMINNGG